MDGLAYIKTLRCVRIKHEFDTYLAAVAAASIDRGRQSNDLVRVDVGPATSTKAGVIPGTLSNRDQYDRLDSWCGQSKHTRPERVVVRFSMASSTGAGAADVALRTVASAKKRVVKRAIVGEGRSDERSATSAVKRRTRKRWEGSESELVGK